MSAKGDIKSEIFRCYGRNGTGSIAMKSGVFGKATKVESAKSRTASRAAPISINTADADRRRVNFITAHDGFTLNDLVSYNDKQQRTNAENNNDGDNITTLNCARRGRGRSGNQRVTSAAAAKIL